jgi:hypothetical protein
MTNFDKKMTKNRPDHKKDRKLEVRTEFLNVIFALGNIVFF